MPNFNIFLLSMRNLFLAVKPLHPVMVSFRCKKCHQCLPRVQSPTAIYNSTADVVFDGLHDIHNGDESLMYAWKVCMFLIEFLFHVLFFVGKFSSCT